MKNKTVIVFIIILALVFPVCTAFSGDTTAGTTGDLISTLKNKVPGLLKLYNVPGASIAIVQDSEVVWVKGFGLADKKRNRAVTENTVFQVASNSKTLTAWGIMKLAEENKCDLDVPVENYLTRWHLPPSRYDSSKVTIRKILSHTAGLSIRGYPGYDPEGIKPTLEESLSGIHTSQTGLQVIRQPGQKYSYSGGGYTLLQLVIEEVTGQFFHDYMKEEILEPLGMMNSSYELEQSILNKTAVAYDIFGKPIPNYLFTEKAAAGLNTTAGDFARFIAAHIRIAGRIQPGEGMISSDSLAMMQTPVKKNYGLGYLIRTLKDNTHYIYHGGTNRGWRSQFAIVPEKETGIVVLTNSDTGEDLYSDVLNIWAKSTLGYVPGVIKIIPLLRIIIWAVGLIALILLIIFIIRKAVNITSGHYWFIFAVPEKKVYTIAVTAVKSIIILACAILWYILWYTGIPYQGWILAGELPFGFGHVSIVLFLWCFILILSNFFRKKSM